MENYNTGFKNTKMHTDGSWGEAANKADTIATGALKNNLEDKLNTMGYNNLRRIIQGEDY